MILKKLKEETSLHHIQLEESALLKAIQDRTISLGQYSKLLQKFYGFFGPLEQRIETFTEFHIFLPDLSKRRKASSLLHDLTFLNRSYKGSLVEICQDLPDLKTVHLAFGSLYVLEGSTLGARVITKILKEVLDLEDQKGGSYFSGYGPETGEKWKTFCQSIETFHQQFPNDEEMIEGARETFVKLRNWLEKE